MYLTFFFKFIPCFENNVDLVYSHNKRDGIKIFLSELRIANMEDPDQTASSEAV